MTNPQMIALIEVILSVIEIAPPDIQKRLTKVLDDLENEMIVKRNN